MRRTKPEKRDLIPDVRYNSQVVQNMIHHIMKRGKMSLATRLVYDAFEMVEDRTKRNGLEIFETAIKNVGPAMEVKPRRVGGATYQVPMEVPADRRMTLAFRWLIDSARARTGNSFSEKLSAEFMEAAANQGSAVRKRDETHKMAEANRAFSHFRL